MEKKTHRLPPGCGYQIVRRLGSGGEGTVYLVCHLSTEQLRAAKILTHVHGDRRHELDMMKHLDHPSLPKVIDVLEQEEDIWLIMEYIRGRRLDAMVGEGLSKAQLLLVARQLTEAVRYLHTRSEPILHLDIKPSNILIRPDGSLVLIDFGAAIRGHPGPEHGGGYGTKGFAAPEQLTKGAGIDARTDLFGIGATLYYCRCGKPPEAGGRTGGPLGAVIQKCLARDPQGRYRDCEQLCRAVGRVIKKDEFVRHLLPAFPVTTLMIFLLLFFFPHRGMLFLNGQDGAPGNGIPAETETEPDTQTKPETETEPDVPSEPETETETEPDARTGSDTETEPDTQTEPAAEGGMNPETETEAGIEAQVQEDPAKDCLRMLKRATADGVFDPEEETALRDLLYRVPDGSDETVLEQIREDEEKYGLLAYRIGLAYWYFYEGSGAKSTAAAWFERALQADWDPGGESRRTAAEVLARIGSYYGMLVQTSEERERLAMEWEYWKDLKELWRLFGEQEEEANIRMEEARELLSLEILKAYEIARCHETQEEMLRIISEIETYVSGSDRQGRIMQEREELMEQSRAARAAVERAFQELMGEENLWVEEESIGS